MDVAIASSEMGTVSDKPDYVLIDRLEFNDLVLG